jgi:dienelactone hydrolase
MKASAPLVKVAAVAAALLVAPRSGEANKGLAKDGRISLMPVMGNSMISGDLLTRLSQGGVRPDPVYSWAARLPEARARLRTLAGPVVLFGFSHGGRVAMRLAVEQPERVVGLVLMAPQVKTMRAAWKKRFGEELPAFEEFRRRGGKYAVMPFNDLDIEGNYDEWAQERGIKVPTLIFHGMADFGIQWSYPERIAKDPQNGPVKAYLFEGQGHFVEAPFMTEKIAELILDPEKMIQDAIAKPVEIHNVPLPKRSFSRLDLDDDFFGSSQRRPPDAHEAGPSSKWEPSARPTALKGSQPPTKLNVVTPEKPQEKAPQKTPGWRRLFMGED